jgi:hypothetical protein
MNKFQTLISIPKFSKKCKNHNFILKFTDKNNPYYECKKCLVITF